MVPHRLPFSPTSQRFTRTCILQDLRHLSSSSSPLGLCHRPTGIYPLPVAETKVMVDYIQEGCPIRRDCYIHVQITEDSMKSPRGPVAASSHRTAPRGSLPNWTCGVHTISSASGRGMNGRLRLARCRYEYLVMPFCLANAPSVFQAFVIEVFMDMLGRQVVLYIDDILVYSATLEDHITHIRAVLEHLLANHLFDKDEKCQINQKAVSFLSY